jgi:hypothetical protein
MRRGYWALGYQGSVVQETGYTELRNVPMTIIVKIPDEFAGQLVAPGQDPCRAVLEAIALEGYRSDRLTEGDIRQLLGFETPMEVHGFLKDHGAFLPYTSEDLAHDSEVARRVAQRARTERQGSPAGGRRSG